MLEITVCMTVLKELIGKELLLATTVEQEYVQKISQHRIVLSQELNESYMKYCEENRINVDKMQQLLASIIGNQEQCRILTGEELSDKFVSEPNPYLGALKNACISSKDKVLISEHSKLKREELKRNGMCLINREQMDIRCERNIFTKYTFPIIAYEIKEKENSKELSSWLGRILSQEKSFVIYDNYFGEIENIKNFKKYVLKYIPESADVMIVTMVSSENEKKQLIKEMSKEEYNKWKIELYLVHNKKESHARAISTPNYSIYLDRGLSTFGRGGKTFASLITIKREKKFDAYRRKIGEKIFP